MRSTLVLAGVALLSALLPATTATAAAVTCGSTIATSMTLAANVGPCPGAGIIIGADNITLDLGGHTLTGSAAVNNDSVGVRIPRHSGVTLSHGTITGFTAGVAILGGGSNIVTGLNLHDNIGSPAGDFGDGVYIGNSVNNTVYANTIIHNGPFEGVGVFGDDGVGTTNTARGNRIIGNQISHNDVIDSRFLPDVTISEDEGVNTGAGVQGSSFNMIRANTITGNGNDGIALCSVFGVPCLSTDNAVVGNTITDNGLLYSDSSGNGIEVVDIVHIPGQPFWLDNFTPVTNDTVAQNTVTRNANHGILIGPQHNQIVNNNVAGNNIAHNLGLDLVDRSGSPSGSPPLCDSNVYQGNTWGPQYDPFLSSYAPGYTPYGSYDPECVGNGGSGPRPGFFTWLNSLPQETPQTAAQSQTAAQTSLPQRSIPSS